MFRSMSWRRGSKSDQLGDHLCTECLTLVTTPFVFRGEVSMEKICETIKAAQEEISLDRAKSKIAVATSHLTLG